MSYGQTPLIILTDAVELVLACRQLNGLKLLGVALRMVVGQPELDMVEMKVRQSYGVPADIPVMVDSHSIIMTFSLRVIISILNLTYVIGTEHHDELIVFDYIICIYPPSVVNGICLIVIDIQHRRVPVFLLFLLAAIIFLQPVSAAFHKWEFRPSLIAPRIDAQTVGLHAFWKVEIELVVI